MFIDREDEIKALDERWNSQKAEMIVIYGRRRVGKTELIDHFIEKKKGIRLLGRTESEKDNLARFSSNLADFFKDSILKANPFQKWDSLLEYLAEKCKSQRCVIAIDEFPYIIDSTKALPSISLSLFSPKSFTISKISSYDKMPPPIFFFM